MTVRSILDDEVARRLNELQQAFFHRGIPSMIMLDGNDGRVIEKIATEIIRCIDPHGISYVNLPPLTKRSPYLISRYMRSIPEKGMIALLDRSWYSSLVTCYSDEANFKRGVERAVGFERYLHNHGVLLMKVIIDADPDLDHDDGLDPECDPDCFLSSEMDVEEKRSRALMKKALTHTDMPYSKFNGIKSKNVDDTVTDVAACIVQMMGDRLSRDPRPMDSTIGRVHPNPRRLADLSLRIRDYDDRMVALTEQLEAIQIDLANSDRSLVLCFEGWDAAGKGSAIKHLCHALNPRGYTLSQVKAPTEDELRRPYLWRFCNSLPDTGRITIYDRSWYGRMMVEPVEGLCTKSEYSRSADEINNFEDMLVANGAIILKFWMEVSPGEQLRRFESRAGDPLKQWKLTDDDWRNRSKRDAYEMYIDAMIESTNTDYAPWVVVESESKKYSRVKVLETVVNALENALNDF